MIEGTYTLTEEEFVEAQSILLRVVQKNFMRMRMWLSCLLLLSLVWGLFQPGLSWRRYTDGRILFVIVLLLLLLFTPWLQARAARKQFGKVKDGFTNLHVRFDDTGYTGDSPGISNGQIYWSAFDGWKEGRSIFALWRSNLVYPIPKHGFSDEDVNRLRTVFESRIVGKPRK